MNNPVKTLSFLAALIMTATGCGPRYADAFSYHFLDNQEEDLAAILERLPEPSHDDRPENLLGQPIAVVATHADDDAARRLIGYRVDTGEQMWEASIAAATQPEILGDVVLVSTREELVAFDLSNGQRLWAYNLPDLAYVGATRDGNTIYWSATVGALGGARRVGHAVAVDARSGGEVWRHEVEGVFGRPAASGGMVFIPWERQNIAILDEETGLELARLRSTDDVVAWAFNHPTGVYYGGRGIYRLTHRNVTGERASSTHIRPPLGDLPRQPESIWPDGYVPQPGTRSARGRIRVYFNPAPSPDNESVRFEGDTYYFAYYRYMFAFDLDGTLRWTRILEQDVANAEAMPHGILTIGEQGSMRLLDRDTGNDRWAHPLEVEVASVAIDAAGFDPHGASGEMRTLRQSLNELALDPDNRLVAARAYAVEHLAAIEEPEVTRDLLDLYQQRSMPGTLKQTIREALRGRRSGAEFLMEALARRYDYLEETEAPPLEAIVPALLEMEHNDAVPRLIQHMMDHETPIEVLADVVDAIVQLGGEDAVEALQRFLVLYQADSQFAGAVADAPPEEEGGEPVRAHAGAQALAAASAGVFMHGGPEGRELLAGLSAESARTHEPISVHIASLYASEGAARLRALQHEEEQAVAALAVAAREAEAALPNRLPQDAINTTFAENADPVRECIGGELERNPRLMQVRLLFILSSDGRASNLTVAPNSSELVDCLRGEVNNLQFPRFRDRRMRAQFVISMRGPSQDDAVEGTQPAIRAVPDDAPWWTWSQRRAELRGVSTVPVVAAWWSEREAPVEEPTQVAVIPDENELPPALRGTQPRAAVTRPPTPTTAVTRPTTTQAARPPAETEPADTGTPWWAAAANDGADEEEDEEEAPTPPPRQRRRQ